MRCLVTGARGFLGSHLVDQLVARGDEVFALVREAGRRSPFWPAGVQTDQSDPTDRSDLTELLKRVAPDQIFHLAAQSYPNVSWQDPQGTFSANLTGTAVLLEAVRAWGGPARVMVTSSSAVYAVSADPIPETGKLAPSSPYGVSKLAADSATDLYHQRYGMNVVRIRPFFLIGPRKRDDVCSDFARRIAHLEGQGGGTMKVGELSMVRDFLDVRDGIAGILTVMEKGVMGEVHNICSGTGYAVRQILDIYKTLANVPVQDELDPALVRPVEEPVKIGYPARLKALGWTPAHTLEQSLATILAYWRTGG